MCQLCDPWKEADLSGLGAQSLNQEKWRRLDVRLRYRVALCLFLLSMGVLTFASLAWLYGWGVPPERTTTTTESREGKEQSKVEVKAPQNPLFSLPVALGFIGLITLTPVITWAIAPGSKIKLPGGEIGHSPDVPALWADTDQAAIKTEAEFARMPLGASLAKMASEESRNTRTDTYSMQSDALLDRLAALVEELNETLHTLRRPPPPPSE